MNRKTLFPPGFARSCTAIGYVSLAAWLLAVVPESSAANRRWAVGNGIFSVASNWIGGVPGPFDVAQFGRSDSGSPFQFAYTVSFTANATNQALHIEDDQVTFDLNGHLYSVTTTNGIVIGNQSGGHLGRLVILDGTIGSATNIDVGAAPNAVGLLFVGIGGLISGSPNITIGKLGTGALTVQTGGDISTTGLTSIGANSGITGTATVTGSGSTLITNTLSVGNNGNGTVNVTSGGFLRSNSTALIGGGDLFTGVGNGTVNVNGTGSEWTRIGQLTVGDGGQGQVNFSAGAISTGTGTVLGSFDSSGVLNVGGNGTIWADSGALTVGALGFGTLNITSLGSVHSVSGLVGSSALGPIHGTGTVNLSGAGSSWILSGQLTVGNAGDGTMNIQQGCAVQNNGAGFVATAAGSTGTVNVNGANSFWHSLDKLTIGFGGQGTLNVTAGGFVSSLEGHIGGQDGSSGTVTIDGAGSRWQTIGVNAFDVGADGTGTLHILDGGEVENPNSNGIIGRHTGSDGAVIVEGPGSTWSMGVALLVGNFGSATLEIRDGGAVSNGTGFVGKGIVTVDGSGSTWINSQDLHVTSLNEIDGGVLNITNGGAVSSLDGFINPLAGTPAAVTIDGPGSTWTTSGQLTVGADPSDGGVGGTLTVTNGGAASAQGGLFVRDLGTLRGNGQVTGNVSNDGVVAPGISPGALHVTGNFAQGAPGELQIELAGTTPGTQYDQLLVSGAVALAGTLEITRTGGFEPQLGQSFVIMTYASRTGAFSNVTGVEAGSGREFLVQYNPNDVTLVVVPSTPGDMNCNGAFNNADISPFVLALTDPIAYQQQFPTCSPLTGDINQDALLNGRDVGLFVNCLLIGGCP